MPTESLDKELKSHFFRQLASQFNRCLEPTLQCQKKAIRAHSVQNSGVLDLLSKDGHVIQLQFHFEGERQPKIEYKSIGRNKATTFTGLCSDHDRAIFEEIDTKPIDQNNKLQLYFLAYRSVLRELHATMDAAVSLQGAYLKLVELGYAPKDKPSPPGVEATFHMLKAWRTYRYKCKYDDLYEGQQFSKLVHVVRIVDIEKPTIAASAFFGVGKYTGAEDIKGVLINVVPLDENKALIVFSYLNEHKLEVEIELGDILVAEGYYLKYLVSKILLKRGENFVINTEYFESWSDDKKETILEYFVSTILDSGNEKDSEHFYLF